MLHKNSSSRHARGKLSEILTTLGRPWIERLGPDPSLESVQLVYSACALVWNMSRAGDSVDWRASLDQVSREVTDGAQADVRQGIIEMIAQARQRADGWLPGDQRLILDLDVRILDDGSFHLSVARARDGEIIET